jgi:N-acetylmuramoyl-L-alanine amidase
MKKIIRILLALFTIVFTSNYFAGIVYASEPDQAGTQLAQPVADVSTNSMGDSDIIHQNNSTELVKVETAATKDTVEEQGTQHSVKVAAAEKKKTSKDVVKIKTKKKQTSHRTYSKKDLRLLSSLVYAEAGNQSYKGMLAVANVVLNRTHSRAYAHAGSVRKVIYDRKWSVQFAVTIRNRRTGASPLDKALHLYDTCHFGSSHLTVRQRGMKKAMMAAKAALQGKNNIGRYLCFTANRNMRGIKNRYSYRIIGAHIFYRLS